MGTISSALNVSTDTRTAIKQALNRSMPKQCAQSQLVSFNEDQIILNTVSKVESLYQLVYFRYLMLQVNGNQRNYKFYVDTNIQHSLSLMYVFIRLVRIDIT